MNTTQRPLYLHDCQHCIYLGTFLVPRSEEDTYTELSDFYYCPKHHDRWWMSPVIIRRLSAAKDDWRTQDIRRPLNCDPNKRPAYTKAAIRAGELGLIDKCTIDLLITDTSMDSSDS